MNRRTVLAVSGISLGSLAGCLGDADDETPSGNGDRTADQEDDEHSHDKVTCTDKYIPYFMFPDEIKEEIDIALAEGSYETDGTLYYDESVATDSILWYLDTEGYDNQFSYADGVGSQYYESVIDKENGGTVLSFEDTTPSDTKHLELSIHNDTDEKIEPIVEITDIDGNAVMKTDPLGDLSGEVIHFSEKFGDYNVEISVDDRPAKTGTIAITPMTERVHSSISIRAEGISFGGHLVHEPFPCHNNGGWWSEGERPRGGSSDM